MSVSTCAHCSGPGSPYEYRGRRFDGLVSVRGERLCSTCAGHAVEPFAIRVTVGVHSWVREPGDESVALLPFFLAGEVSRARRGLSPDRRSDPA